MPKTPRPLTAAMLPHLSDEDLAVRAIHTQHALTRSDRHDATMVLRANVALLDAEMDRRAELEVA